MKIQTRSGKIYSFYVENNRFVLNNGWEKGVVLTLSGIEVGESLIITYLPIKNGTISEDSQYIQTTKITSITSIV